MLSLARSYGQVFSPGGTLAAAACLAGGVVCTQVFDPRTVVPHLELRFDRADLNSHGRLDGIVVLGGGSARMIEAVRLAKLHPDARLLISGRGEQYWHGYAIKSGIEPTRILTETGSRNTYENAIFSSRIAQPRRHERWLLVTSAAHMPRAMGVFRKAGFNPLAWPVHQAHVPQSTLSHEWLGLAAYRLMGRTETFLPAPNDDAAAHLMRAGSASTSASAS